MLSLKLKRVFQEEVQELLTPATTYTGANRRAVNLVPLPLSTDGHELAQTKAVRFHQLLVSIEGNQRTCVLKIISPKKRSRAALLVFRGRVLGCLYGKRDLEYHFFHQDAHSRAMTDLAFPGNILDAYSIPEDLALSAASLFHGQTLDLSHGFASQTKYEAAVHQVMNFGLPGCVVVSTPQNEMVAMIYISGGRILGVYSSRDGWVESSVMAGMHYVETTRNAQVMASVLPIRTLDDVARLGFSLTGLADRKTELWRQLNQRSLGMENMPLRPIDYYEAQVAHQVSSHHYTLVRRNQASKYHRHAHQIWV